jgi:hypothetical protein
MTVPDVGMVQSRLANAGLSETQVHLYLNRALYLLDYINSSSGPTPSPINSSQILHTFNAYSYQSLRLPTESDWLK